MWTRMVASSCRFHKVSCHTSISVGSLRRYSGVRSATEVYHEPPACPPNLFLRVYVNPFCPFAQVI